MSPKLWVILTGGILGIVAMRLVIGQLLTLVQRYPALVDGAFVIIAWVGIKLLIEYAAPAALDLAFEMPKWLSLGLIVVIFGAGYLMAIKQGPVEISDEADQANDLLQGVATPATRPGWQRHGPARGRVLLSKSRSGLPALPRQFRGVTPWRIPST